ncbi:hypothetical protein [Phaeocystidibacter luteus]|uniref:Lipoprotein n=1 Tax=Phaeocystidibacter luteus TaxID=911197 RepID=A0A6N6RG40_9FLAO|nr:hypothetical protein [Phaeocystidibacter luteus]KAB2810110.1 hypothetical protein F8C67_07695 [Phaeocystidibacter luteus]
MKLPLLLAVCAAVTLSCNSSNNSENTDVVDTPKHETTNASCNITDQKVSRDVFEEWMTEYSNFASTHGYTDANGIKLNQSVTMYSVDSTLMSEFTSRCTDCNAVRVYFGASQDNETGIYTPFLMFTNVASSTCNDTAFNENGILMIQPLQGSGLISPDAAAAYYNTWQTYLTSVQTKMPSMLNVEAYTFTRDAFNTAFTDGGSTLGIYLGMHTVMPDDTMYEHPEVNDGAEGWITFNLVVTSLNDQGTYADNSHMDFSSPCPKFCPPVSFYTAE